MGISFILNHFMINIHNPTTNKVESMSQKNKCRVSNSLDPFSIKAIINRSILIRLAMNMIKDPKPTILRDFFKVKSVVVVNKINSKYAEPAVHAGTKISP